MSCDRMVVHASGTLNGLLARFDPDRQLHTCFAEGLATWRVCSAEHAFSNAPMNTDDRVAAC